ncbi:Carboxymuconolactone decarboxylase family protein [Vibrio aerogenes CECT 7868]|uniref:Carboxymuconolactone decarboxylase family protein n=1 Tax=Vibrio aerogenes CECT 7868 TaxID=1216006 RepID=A0A1M5XA47_9VIBR|nr:carboxymuconolactone decarboxylase family protein [Vibrio aerogenes]SHH96735.1 Carboxymuconolactone decarboxylase family protein [Vibrio aerogenes CECT 7868]
MAGKNIKNELNMLDLAPKFKELTEHVLYDDIWQRAELSPRERSLVTISSLLSLGRFEQLDFHIQHAENNGITTSELTELCTHLAFYAGWPAAVSALTRIKNRTIR